MNRYVQRTFLLCIGLVFVVAVTVSGSGSMTSAITGATFRWDLSLFPSGAIPYLINPIQPADAVPVAPAGTSASDLVSLVRSAFQIWQDVPTSAIKYAYQGTTSRTSGLDGFNVVTFSPAGAVPASGITIISTAIGPGPVTMPDGSTINASFAGQILDADIVVNPQTSFSIAEGILPTGQIPLEGTVTHEVGHFSGLDHSGIVGTVMYGFFNLGRGRINRAPREDDIFGISVQYPTPAFSLGTGEISGTVSGAGGAPVFGAQIVAVDSGSGTVIGATLSGVADTRPDGAPSSYSRTSGRYVLKGLPPGNYSVLAEPLDGPATPFLSGAFGSGVSGASLIESGFLPSAPLGPFTVTAGNSTHFDIGIDPKSAASPNLGASPFAALPGQSFVSPAEVEAGSAQTVSIGSNENLVDGSNLVGAPTFAVSGAGVSLGSPSALSNFLRLPVTVATNAIAGPRLLTATTAQGTSVVSGGMIVIPPALSFAQFANGAGNTSTTVVVNPSTTATAVGRIVFRDDGGSAAKTGLVLSSGDPEPVQKSSFDFIVAPQGLTAIHSDGLGNLISGAATLRATQRVGGIIKFAIPGLGIAGVEQGAPVSGLITPVRRNASINTGIAIGNATAQEFPITLSIRTRLGAFVAADATRTLAANGHIAAFITELFPNADLRDFDGTLTVTTGGSARLITATALEIGTSAGEFTALPVTEIQDQPGERILRFAQFANGGGVRSDLVITNATTNATLNGRVDLFDDLGNPLTTGITGVGSASRLDFSIPPRGSRTFSSDGIGVLSAGWARVTTDRPSGGVIRFSLPGLGIAGVGKSDALEQGFIIPIRTNVAQGLDTGVALVNDGDAPVSLLITLRDASGVTVAGGDFVLNGLPSRGHVARMTRQLFPNAALDDFEGTLTVVVQTPGGRVSGTALELGSGPGQFTTLPVVPRR